MQACIRADQPSESHCMYRRVQHCLSLSCCLSAKKRGQRARALYSSWCMMRKLSPVQHVAGRDHLILMLAVIM